MCVGGGGQGGGISQKPGVESSHGQGCPTHPLQPPPSPFLAQPTPYSHPYSHPHLALLGPPALHSTLALTSLSALQAHRRE